MRQHSEHKHQSLSNFEEVKAERCELCGAEGKTVMHHVRTLKDLKERTVGTTDAQKHRKTLAVCETCNAKIHVR